RDVNPTRAPDELGKKLAEASEKMDGAVVELLDKARAARLRQIELQQVEKTGLAVLLADARVVKGLGLDRDQQERINTLQQDTSRVQQLMFSELFAGPNPSAEVSKTSEAFREASEKKLRAVLTDAQRTRLKELLGEPFKGQIRPRGIGGFGGGGFGGF